MHCTENTKQYYVVVYCESTASFYICFSSVFHCPEMAQMMKPNPALKIAQPQQPQILQKPQTQAQVKKLINLHLKDFEKST